MIGGDRARVRVILVETDAVREIGAEFAEHPAHPAEDEIGLSATLMVMAKHRVAGRPQDGLVDHAGAPVIGLVAGQKDPWSGIHCIGIVNRCPEQIFD
jgi:hypothetical protein